MRLNQIENGWHVICRQMVVERTITNLTAEFYENDFP